MGLYQYDSTEDKLNLVAGSTNFSDAPVGAIFPFGGTDIPVSFLLCDGSAVSRTDYEDLFAVIGTAFGTGDGSTTFNLPDLREAVPKGAGLTGKTVGAHLDADGLAVGEFLDDRIQNIGKMKAQATSGYSLTSGGVAGYINANSTLRTGDTTEVKSVGVNYIIKAKQIGMPTDFASGVEEYINDNATSEISSSNKLVTESDITPTEVESFTTGACSVFLYKNSGMFLVIVTGRSEGTAYTNGLICTFQNKPKKYITMSCYYAEGGTSKQGYISIDNENGEVKLRNTSYNAVTANVASIRGEGWFV